MRSRRQVRGRRRAAAGGWAVAQLIQVGNRLSITLGRAPTVDELAQMLDLSPRRVAALCDLPSVGASLQQPAGTDGDAELGELLVDEHAARPDLAIIERERDVALADLLATLPERERRVVELRYGLSGQDEHTLSGAAVRMALSKERVRQIESGALRRLRTLAESTALRDVA